MSPYHWHCNVMGQTKAGDSYEWAGIIDASSMHVAGSRAVEMLEEHTRADCLEKKKPRATLEWCKVECERWHVPVSPGRQHRETVERASFTDCDGVLWNGSEPWRDGQIFVDLFWTYYAPLIPEQMHGRALRALIHATPHGTKHFATSTEFRTCLKATLGPFLTRGRTTATRDCECAWCGRPGVTTGQQCQGCGAWRRAL